MQIEIELAPGYHAVIRGSGAVADAVERELSGARAFPLPSSELVLSLEITEEASKDEAGPRLGPVRATSSGVIWRLDRMDYELAIESESPLRVAMHIGHRGPPFRIPRALFAALERTAMSWADAQAYHAVLLIEFFALMSGRLGVMHASAVERGGKVLAITSAGGVGKTTSALRLIERAGFHHVADDILVVDAMGRCRPSFRKMMIYPYNLKDAPQLERAVRAEDTIRGRILWDLDRVLRLGRRRRRVPLANLFGERLASSGELHALVFLRRLGRPALELSDISPQSLSERANELVLAEYQPFVHLLRTSAALLGDAFAWSVAHVTKRNRENLISAMSRAERLCIADLGHGCDPTEAFASLVSA